MFSRCDTDFNIDRHLIPFLQEVPFFAELSRQINKIPTKDLPTAAITFNVKSDEVRLYWNPDFFNSMTNWQIRGVLTHEFYHFIFGHLNTRRKSDGRLWNVATDLAINSIIVNNAKETMPRDASAGDTPLPACALIPGQWPVHPDGRELSKEEKDGSVLGALISKFPMMNASEWYFDRLKEEQKNNKGKGKGKGKGSSGPGGQNDPDGESGGDDDDGMGEDWIDSLDDHASWDDIPDDKREYIEGRIKSMVEKAVKYADSQQKGWGNMPADLVNDIRRSVSQIIDWRAVLRQFVGSLIRGHRTTSIKRINKRYPYIHPGTKRGYHAKLIIAMDQSGSVSNELCELFFAELSQLTKRVTIDILPFDCHCDEKEIFTWRKGAVPPLKRTKMGGTDFNAPTNIINDKKNRGRWDGMLIMTDGECSEPSPSRIKRGWVLGPHNKLMFSTNELQVFVDQTRQITGAWR